MPWIEITRAKYWRERVRYASDMTDVSSARDVSGVWHA
jgi:hypothetical protein